MRFLRDLLEGRKAPAARERRGGRRARTRLRPGKLLDARMDFVADCAILDRTAEGMRVRCFGAIGSADDPLAVFDEKDGTLRRGRIVWHRDGEAGLRLEKGDAAVLDPKLRLRLSAPYYAVVD